MLCNDIRSYLITATWMEITGKCTRHLRSVTGRIAAWPIHSTMLFPFIVEGTQFGHRLRFGQPGGHSFRDSQIVRHPCRIVRLRFYVPRMRFWVDAQLNSRTELAWTCIPVLQGTASDTCSEWNVNQSTHALCETYQFTPDLCQQTQWPVRFRKSSKMWPRDR